VLLGQFDNSGSRHFFRLPKKGEGDAIDLNECRPTKRLLRICESKKIQRGAQRQNKRIHNRKELLTSEVVDSSQASV